MMDGGVPNIKKWVVLYPVYINSKKTIAEGRRISAEKACENPTCVEIGDCCGHLKLPFAIEVSFAIHSFFSLIIRACDCCLFVIYDASWMF
jgi:signal recognition particle subunit SRP19